MKLFNKVATVAAVCASAVTMSAFAHGHHHHNHEKDNKKVSEDVKETVSDVKDAIAGYAKDIPGIGLIAESIAFDGITISNFTFDNEHKYIFVKQGDTFTAHMNYAIDTSAYEGIHRHHFIIGLHDAGPQQCLIHSLGILNSEGSASVTLTAPMKRGAYQVRFCHSIGLTDAEAQQAWWRGEGDSAKTIVGVVVVQ